LAQTLSGREISPENQDGLRKPVEVPNYLRETKYCNISGKRPFVWKLLESLKAMLHGAIFLATCNAILLLRDVKLPNTSLHYTAPQSKYIQSSDFRLI
jgi:hypothetical protein